VWLVGCEETDGHTKPAKVIFSLSSLSSFSRPDKARLVWVAGIVQKGQKGQKEAREGNRVSEEGIFELIHTLFW
jgi:hypothetical protein